MYVMINTKLCLLEHSLFSFFPRAGRSAADQRIQSLLGDLTGELIGCRQNCHCCPPLAPITRPPCLPIQLLSFCYFYPFIFLWYWLKACNLLHLELHLLNLRSKEHAKVHPRRTYHLCRKCFRVFQVNIKYIPDAVSPGRWVRHLPLMFAEAGLNIKLCCNSFDYLIYKLKAM